MDPLADAAGNSPAQPEPLKVDAPDRQMAAVEIEASAMEDYAQQCAEFQQQLAGGALAPEGEQDQTDEAGIAASPESSPAAEVQPLEEPIPATTPEVEQVIESAAPLTEAGKRPPQFRLRPKDDLEERTFLYRARNPEMSIADCLALAQKDLGLGQTPNAVAAHPVAPPTEQDIAAIQAKIDALEDEQDNSYEDAEAKRARREEIRSLQRQILPQAVAAKENARQTAERIESERVNQIYDQASSQAVNLYPVMKDMEGPFWKRAEQIDQDLQRLGDPLYDDPEKPLHIARMVAREMDIAPMSPTSRPQAAASAPQARTGLQPSTTVVASPPLPRAPIGSGLTHAAAAPDMLARFSAISNSDDYEVQAAQFLASLRS